MGDMADPTHTPCTILHMVPPAGDFKKRGRPAGGQSVEWHRLADKWIQGRVRRREIAVVTARNQRCALDSFCDVLGNAATIRSDHVDRWLEARAGCKASTIRSDFSAVRGWCQWLAHDGLIAKDPTFGRRGPKEPRRMPRYIESDDILTILSYPCDARLHAICWLMFGGGLRCIEVAGITIGDFDRRQRLVRVIGKGGHEREAALPVQAIRAVDRYLAEHPATVGPLFRSYRRPAEGLVADTIGGLVSKLMDECGVKQAPRDGVSAHAFRHTCASDLLDASDGNLWLVAEQLGHKNLQTLRIYLRPARSAETRQAMDGRAWPATA